ncbi:E6 protein [Human papillomavirus type 221]|uniref:Protein E6 n=1 Tax=Human papillomavirus type 221 TaxID=2200958 RepID=A0A2S1ZRX9_9PAPI|nr:E6 protein [Human papillomavirus type 221]
MDLFTSPFPETLSAYCQLLGLQLSDVRLPCNFCKFYLTEQDLAAFHLKQFKLIWKGPWCYACCRSCARLTAAYELRKFYQCTCNCNAVEGLAKTTLDCIPVRCLQCLALLSFAEKLEHLAIGQDFYLVRSTWKGYCRNCIKKN